MQSRIIRNQTYGLLTIRPLRNGDTGTVAAVFDRLGNESRARRFNGAKPQLSASELAQLARVDAGSHTLVAYVEGDPRPAALAQLVRDADLRTHAEIAFAVADPYQGHGVGSALVELLAADARAAGLTHLTATVQGSNAAAYSLIRKIARVVDVRYGAGEASIVAAFQSV
ncbi:MAG TPA: GNAT family N-acetyltransferase [Gaiellaceae bacterium]